MTVESLAAWVGIIVGVLSLAAIAWSAVQYVLLRRREVAHQEYQRFFEILDQVGKPGGSIASKMGAFYELRKYPDYKDVIVRICREVEVAGDSAGPLKAEMLATAKYLEGPYSKP